MKLPPNPPPAVDCALGIFQATSEAPEKLLVLAHIFAEQTTQCWLLAVQTEQC